MGRKDKPVPSSSSTAPSVGMQLRYARQSRKISLTDMAKKLKYSKGYLSGMENGNIRVSEGLVRLYEEALELEFGSLDELIQVLRRAESTTGQAPWYVPHQRNPFFTGREDLLQDIHERLTGGSALPRALAITGLGGVGKTQLVMEYAYRYRDRFRAVLWFDGNSWEALVASCIDLANYLDLPEKNAQNQNTTVKILQHWIEENPGSLIILDNVDDPTSLRDFLLQFGESYIIMTTRTQIVGMTAQTLELREMVNKEGVLLLLRRAKIIPLGVSRPSVSENTLALASEISESMAGLPLALNQAGSYIEETGCGLANYLDLLKEQLVRMLRESDQASTDYHASVAATWTLSFDKIKQKSSAAAELLYFCSFLNPDKIYEEFIAAGASALGPVLSSVAVDLFELHRAVGELRKYSLVRTDPDSGALSVHRLVQAVIQDMLDLETRSHWANRTVRAVNRAFPLVTVSKWHETWSKCQRYFPQVERCIKLIDEWKLVDNEVSQLLNKVGKYLEERRQFDLAEGMYRHALRLDEQTYGREHIAVANDLSNLAMLYEKSGKDEHAEILYREALFIQEKVVGMEHGDILVVKNYIRLLQKMDREREAVEWNQRYHTARIEQSQRILRRLPINDSDEGCIIYSVGDWKPRSHVGDFNSDAHTTSTRGAFFECDFTGVGIEIISDTSTPSAHGKVDIYIDSEYVQTVNTSRISNQLTQTIIFSKTDLEQGAHRLKVVVEEGAFILDALAIFSFDEDVHTEQPQQI